MTSPHRVRVWLLAGVALAVLLTGAVVAVLNTGRRTPAGPPYMERMETLCRNLEADR